VTLTVVRLAGDVGTVVAVAPEKLLRRANPETVLQVRSRNVWTPSCVTSLSQGA